ncbi:hypothetical protein BREVNS_1437 [Brevinematales bacterium NS]|nr:hypothetical protein [Brevinematales bacterium]QJR22187.1 hypothetical protein BREVNS_1437 [Brevinematales bacterium NS]
MKRYFVLLVFLVMAIFGCGMKKTDIYYPKAHYTQMTLDQADKKVIYVDWGNPLVYAGKMQTNSEVVKGKTNEVIYVLVQKQDTKEKGWVSLSSVVKNPVAKATLLNTTQIYKTPNEVSREFFTMVAPMIGYVVEIQEGWARVQWYMAAYKTFTGKSDWTTYEWVKLSEISTNANEADLLSLAYVSYKKLADWQAKWPTLTDEKQKLSMSNEIETEIIYLEKAIKNYGGAYGPVASSRYVANIVDSLRSLIYPPIQEEYTEESYDGEEMSEEY